VRERCSTRYRSRRRCVGGAGPGGGVLVVRVDWGVGGWRTRRRRESKDCVRMEWEGFRMSSERRISSLPL
jgi:hypothetical protein